MTSDIFDYLQTPEYDFIFPESARAHKNRIGNQILRIQRDYPDWDAAEIVLVGCDMDLQNEPYDDFNGVDLIRRELYQMYDWHQGIKVADVGNIKRGATPRDTRVALFTVLNEIWQDHKIAVVLGGSHDLLQQQCQVFEKAEKKIDIINLDRFIDLDDSEGLNDRNFLLPMLTKTPNFINHYSHLGFQSYDVNPNVLETLDKLGFDCVRLGTLKENLEEAEPVFRHTSVAAIDLQVLRHSEALFLKAASPNGLFGDEICQLTKYAGMSPRMSSLGIYGYQGQNDVEGLGAKLVAQMLWYFVDGYRIRTQEMDLNNLDNFISYHVDLAGSSVLFIQSKRTRRWWMQLPDQSFIPCSYNDYVKAVGNEIPERFLRAQNRVE